MARNLAAIGLGVALAISSASGSFAQTAVESVVSQLEAQGYARIETRRTLLGRVRILAVSDTLEREIILSPRSGVVLRDFWRVIDDDEALRPGLVNPELTPDDPEDDPDEEDDEEEDEDEEEEEDNDPDDDAEDDGEDDEEDEPEDDASLSLIHI